MVGSVLAALVSAFVTGALARFAVPGPDPMPLWLTLAIGVAGTLVGSLIVVATGLDAPWAGVAAFLTAVVLVLVYRRFFQRRPLWGPGAYRFPNRGFGVDQYRERLQRAGIDPDKVAAPFAQAAPDAASPLGRSPVPVPEDPTENPAHYLQLLEELHDSGVLEDEEYTAARTRLLERLRP